MTLAAVPCEAQWYQREVIFDDFNYEDQASLTGTNTWRTGISSDSVVSDRAWYIPEWNGLPVGTRANFNFDNWSGPRLSILAGSKQNTQGARVAIASGMVDRYGVWAASVRLDSLPPRRTGNPILVQAFWLFSPSWVRFDRVVGQDTTDRSHASEIDIEWTNGWGDESQVFNLPTTKDSIPGLFPTTTFFENETTNAAPEHGWGSYYGPDENYQRFAYNGSSLRSDRYSCEVGYNNTYARMNALNCLRSVTNGIYCSGSTAGTCRARRLTSSNLNSQFVTVVIRVRPDPDYPSFSQIRYEWGAVSFDADQQTEPSTPSYNPNTNAVVYAVSPWQNVSNADGYGATPTQPMRAIFSTHHYGGSKLNSESPGMGVNWFYYTPDQSVGFWDIWQDATDMSHPSVGGRVNTTGRSLGAPSGATLSDYSAQDLNLSVDMRGNIYSASACRFASCPYDNTVLFATAEVGVRATETYEMFWQIREFRHGVSSPTMVLNSTRAGYVMRYPRPVPTNVYAVEFRSTLRHMDSPPRFDDTMNAGEYTIYPWPHSIQFSSTPVHDCIRLNNNANESQIGPVILGRQRTSGLDEPIPVPTGMSWEECNDELPWPDDWDVSESLLASEDSSPQASALPSELSLGSVYPNPASGAARIDVGLPIRSEFDLVVVDVLGREVLVLGKGFAEAGWHSVSIDAGALSSGIYTLRLISEGEIVARRFTIVK